MFGSYENCYGSPSHFQDIWDHLGSTTFSPTSSLSEALTPPTEIHNSPNSPYGVTLTSSPKSSGKKYKYGPRDSLASRYRLGLPGSKRYRYWENEFFLIKNLSETESEIDESDDEWEKMPRYGAFGEVFEGNNFQLIEPFLDVTEEEQNRLLSELYDSDDEIPAKQRSQKQTPSEIFKNMPKKHKRILKKDPENALLGNLDDILHEYANSGKCTQFHESLSADEEQLTFNFKGDSKARHFVHSLCVYYNLVSYSRANKKGVRITYVYKKEDRTSPKHSVVKFLVSKYKNGVCFGDKFIEGLDYVNW